MADFQPDTSFYTKAPSGLAGMSPGDLVSLIQHTQDFQTSQAVSDALKGATDPQTGMVDYTKGIQSLISDPRASRVTPQIMQSMTQGNQSQFDLKKNQFTTASGLIGSLITKMNTPQGVTSSDMANAAATLRSLGIGNDIVSPFVSVDPKDRNAIGTILAKAYNYSTGNAGLPTFETYNPKTGKYTNTPAGSLAFPQGGQPAGTSPPPAGPQGSYTSKPPIGSETTLTAAGQDSAKLLAGGTQRAQNIGMLKNLQGLSDEAVSGPQSGFEKRANQLWQRMFPGDKLTLTPQQLSSSEEYAKIAETMVGNMANSGHATDAFLNNAYGSNPNLELSKLGRQGITHWLMGNVDAESTIATQWQQWRSQHPGQDNSYYDWLHDPNGMNIEKFDPRVFQYMRMSPTERASFRGMMSKPEQRVFMSNFDNYKNKGWLSATQ